LDKVQKEKTAGRALILLSGGQDSSTALYWALKRFSALEAVFFHYQQRHAAEYESARKAADREGLLLHELDVPAFAQIGGTAMIEERDIQTPEGGLPNTFVPGRNIVFLTLAASLAWNRDILDLIIGVNEMDYSGYPDCREDFIRSMERSLSLGLDRNIRIHAPLSRLDKAGIWALSDELGVLDRVRTDSHTCYLGVRKTLYDWGYGCGSCPACLLRREGFEKYMQKRTEGSV